VSRPAGAGDDVGDAAPGDDVLDSSRAGGMLIRGAAARLVGFAAMVALSVLSVGVLTRHLGVVRFGQYTTVTSVVAVVAAVTDVGMSNFGAREYAIRSGRDRTVLMQSLLGLRVTLTMIGLVAVIAFALAAGYDAALLIGAVIAGVATVPLVVQHTLSIPLATGLRQGTITLLELGRQVLAVGGLVALALGGSGVTALLAVPLVVNLLLIPPTAALVRGELSSRISFSVRAWPALLRVTIVFSLASAVGQIYIYTAQILTSLIASRHQSGLFAISFRVFLVTSGISGILVGAALPLLSRAARDDRDRLGYALQRIFEAALIAGAGAALAMSTGAGFIVAVTAGPSFSAAAPVLATQAWAMVASFLLAGWSFALLSLHDHRRLLLSSTAALLASLVLTSVLASSDGARGAALATVGGETTLALATLLALAHGRPQFRPQVAVVLKVGLALAAGAGLSALLSVPSLPRSIAATLVYTAVILVTGAIPRELLSLLPGRR